MALGLQHPWKLNNVDFVTEEGEKILRIDIGFEKGAKFLDPDTGEPCPVHATERKGAATIASIKDYLGKTDPARADQPGVYRSVRCVYQRCGVLVSKRINYLLPLPRKSLII